MLFQSVHGKILTTQWFCFSVKHNLLIIILFRQIFYSEIGTLWCNGERMKRKLWYLSQNQNKEKLSQIILKNQAILTQASFTLKVKEVKPASKGLLGASTVVEWLRIHLPIQGTLVRSLVGELRSHVPWQLSLYASTTEIAGHNEKKTYALRQRAHAPQT